MIAIHLYAEKHTLDDNYEYLEFKIPYIQLHMNQEDLEDGLEFYQKEGWEKYEEFQTLKLEHCFRMRRLK